MSIASAGKRGIVAEFVTLLVESMGLPDEVVPTLLIMADG